MREEDEIGSLLLLVAEDNFSLATILSLTTKHEVFLESVVFKVDGSGVL